ncbi:SUF system NifU family Fe-S cluster assembly protein [Carboxydochorda subterranea]|uniref:SUF system NifU family Fe-S cluster assembly protein n=1 Tax=Carboxydichorda subterranea TaxID=3109565 RepID=A0ABZ1C0V8_9FIRM|nr:SUF system NifU family Fe-S cluster assembly protein [Limnochorda sp. L945t]WRP18638.1 SUF system NifU family Fe-S cluster assembly protein [Limnochorda sp. L945t]
MNTGMEDLYREVILDHYRAPRNKGSLEHADASCHLHNPLCGDDITLALAVEGDVIRDARFVGQGCSISQASASMMTEAIKGKTVAEARELIDRFSRLMRGEIAPGEADLGDLEALSGVSRFPVRVKCALLAWEALDKDLAQLTRPAPGG